MTIREKTKARARSAPSTYGDVRDREQLDVHKALFKDFVRSYKEGSHAAPGVNRRTLFFFPGGMGSKLKRSRQPFNPRSPNRGSGYDQVWGGHQTVTGGAFLLGMYRQGNEYRDRDDHIVIADGAFDFFGSVPHEGLIRWCKKNNIDLFVFNWDWRRPLEETTRFFVERFWCAFVERMTNEGIPQAAQNYSLLGHCFGGMIVNLILRSDNPVAQGLRYAITLATPFYGYPGQVHRWFEGEPILNGPDTDHRDKMISIICSLPALYVLHSPDRDVTWPRDEQLLANDQGQNPAYPLPRYPTLDKKTGDPIDPWKQDGDSNGRVRYPVRMGFMEDELRNAKRVYQLLAQPLADDRFYNIRGVAKGLGNHPSKATHGSITQDWISSHFNPDRERPIHDEVKFPGDGVQPAWTARLASNAPERCKTVTASGIDHTCITSHRDFLTQLGKILFQGKKFEFGDDIPLPHMATDGEAEEFIGWLRGYVEGYKVAKRIAPSDRAVRIAMEERYGQKVAPALRWILEHVFKMPTGALR